MPYEVIVKQTAKKIITAAGYTALGYDIGEQFSVNELVKYEQKPVIMIIHDRSDQLATSEFLIYSTAAMLVSINVMVAKLLLTKLYIVKRANQNRSQDTTEELESNDIIV